MMFMPPTSFYIKRRSGVFNELGKKKLPSINMLRQEWATLDSEKKTLYRDYHELKDHRTDLANAKVICDKILGIEKDETAHNAERVQKRSYAHEI